MEVIEKVIPYKRPDIFHVYPFGDLHGGSIHCIEDDAKAEITKIAKQDNALVIGMGDYTESILKNDPRFDTKALAPWVKQDNIVECQREWVVDLLKPVKNKIVCLLTGNHEEEEHNRYQNDVTRNICKDLDVPYGGYQCFINLKFWRCQNKDGSKSAVHEYLIHAWHGAGAAQSEGAQVMRLMRLVNEIEADIYLMGHLHGMAQYSRDRLMCRRGKIKATKVQATITGSWLKGYNQPQKGQELNPSYVEQKGYKPNRLGCPVIHICPDKDWFTIES